MVVIEPWIRLTHARAADPELSPHRVSQPKRARKSQRVCRTALRAASVSVAAALTKKILLSSALRGASSVEPTTTAENPIITAKARMIQKPFEGSLCFIFSASPQPTCQAASAQVVERVPVREFLAAPAVVVATTDELVPVRVMSSLPPDSFGAMFP